MEVTVYTNQDLKTFLNRDENNCYSFKNNKKPAQFQTSYENLLPDNVTNSNIGTRTFINQKYVDNFISPLRKAKKPRRSNNRNSYTCPLCQKTERQFKEIWQLEQHLESYHVLNQTFVHDRIYQNKTKADKSKQRRKNECKSIYMPLPFTSTISICADRKGLYNEKLLKSLNTGNGAPKKFFLNVFFNFSNHNADQTYKLHFLAPGPSRSKLGNHLWDWDKRKTFFMELFTNNVFPININNTI